MNFDDVQIPNFSRRIVDKALQPRALANYILDYLDDEAEAADLLALRIAIDSRYPEFRERFVFLSHTSFAPFCSYPEPR